MRVVRGPIYAQEMPAAMASLPPPEELRALAKRIQSAYLLNKQLQLVCQWNGMKTAGVKAELQKRIIDALNKAYYDGDSRTYREIEQSIHRAKNGHNTAPQSHNAISAPIPTAANHAPSAMPTNVPNTYGYQANGYGGYGGIGSQRAQPTPPQGTFNCPGVPPLRQTLYLPVQRTRELSNNDQGFAFRQSPFYHVVDRVGAVHMCEAMAQHRNTVSVQIKAADNPFLSQCVNDKSMRVMVFCAASNYGPQDITFPHQSELKVNGDDVKANLRGLKNKPGSTRPVDITDLLRLRVLGYANNVEFTYALTNKRFYLVVNICRTVPTEKLVQTISSKKISKDSVVRDLTRKAHDAEIELSSQVLSLKCPLSYMRLVTPCRGDTCTHVQCFDATSYLQLQQQGPQWLCPVCSKPTPFERLAIDDYVRDILENTSDSVEQVDIEPNGEWKAHGPVEDKPKAKPEYNALPLDDDDLVISEVSYQGHGNRSTNTPTTLAATTGAPTPTPGASREGSSMSRPGGNKRSHADVIDLTLSDDDDGPPQPPSKRQQSSRPGSSFPAYL